MAIEYVGRRYGVGNSLNSVSVSLVNLNNSETTPDDAQEGDLVLVILGRTSTSNLTLSLSTSGYTKLLDLYADDTRDANLAVFYKIMGSTPDTSVGAPAGTSGDGYTFIAMVFRGVDQTTPIDVASTSATGVNGMGINPPSITPVTSGAWVIVGGHTTQGELPSANPSGITNQVADGTTSPTREAAFVVAQVRNASGATNIGAWTYAGSSSSDSWASFAVALRPAAGGRIKVWDGATWNKKPVKWWNGSAWVEKPLKRWNG